MWLDPSTALAAPAHARWLESEFDALAGFASDAGTPFGFGYLDSVGEIIPEQGHDLYITCRMVHTFALAHLLGRPGGASQVDHGLAALNTAFRDREHSGWFTSLSADGSVRDDSKGAYAHAFVVLAAASATAAERPGAEELLGEALAVINRHFWQESEGMCAESFDRSFAAAEEYRGLNSNMHMVEAFLAAAEATADDLWLERALRITQRSLDGFAREHGWRIPEHYTPQWEPVLDYHDTDPAHPFRPAGATIGHWFEWARLALQIEAALTARGKAAPEFLVEAARALFEVAVEDGWSTSGADGFIYTVDFSGRPIVRERMHWVIAEAIAASAVLFQRTGEAFYERWYRLWWEYAAVHVIDPEGSWIHELSPENDLSESIWVGKPDIYHSAQATLIPRVSLTPALANAIARGALDRVMPASNRVMPASENQHLRSGP